MSAPIQITANEQGSEGVIFQIQTDLLRLVDELMKEGRISTPAEIVNELIDHWLMTPAVELARDTNPNQLRTVKLLINLLAHMRKDNHGIIALTATVYE